MGYSFAFTATNQPDPAYGNFMFYYINVTFANQTNEGRLKTMTLLNYENCTKKLFGFENEAEFYTTGL